MGLAPTGKAPPFHGARRKQPFVDEIDLSARAIIVTEGPAREGEAGAFSAIVVALCRQVNILMVGD